jgi:hypothetical protein
MADRTVETLGLALFARDIERRQKRSEGNPDFMQGETARMPDYEGMKMDTG